MPESAPWFDAHLDLAYLAENGRDMHASASDCRGRYQPAAVTLPELRAGRVTHCLATVFTEGIDPGDAGAEAGPYTYPRGDAEAAHRAGMRQLKLYQAWRQAGQVAPMGRRGAPAPSPSADLSVGVLVECADPILDPEHLDEWVAGGVVAIGLAWWHQGRYAAGNGTDAADPSTGLTDLGRALVARMDAAGLVHDLSHLSQRATDELLAATGAPVMASHSNCRALLGGQDNPQWQRHLADETIAEIGRRGGMIGLNLVRSFIRAGLGRAERPALAEAIDHVEHVCAIVGHRGAVGLGSDMDGGITADDLPLGIDTPADLPKLAAELSARGWSDAEVAGFRWGNWARFWGLV